MDAVVIPWFLVLTSFSAINNTDIRTDHGPVYETEPNHGFVYTYDVFIDSTWSPEKNAMVDHILNFTSTLKCWARNESVLFCTLDDRKMDNIDFKNNRHYRIVQTSQESFEIDYNEAGVERLRAAASTTSNKKFGLVKTIVSQLNVGTNFGKQKSFAFATNETSFLGECETVFNVVESACTKYPRSHDIRMRSILHDSLGDSVLIRKRRNTRNCDRPNEVYLIDDLLPTVTSSYSEMRVCADSFESSTIVEGKAIAVNREAKAMVFRQVVKIRLEKVEKAKEDPPTFDADTVTDIIYLHKDVDHNEVYN